ncbi:MAG: multidrug ABC transporter substrate-binding protein [Acidobacteria bacterium]|jgi:putative ABC transport system permease protein|nr:multidrug ABC transporter substrate-binding protein [Acidobacteriota bacterium]HJN44294.1 ABC transporter permease [Vicinamibacterales bacterium]|tara:strand:- start:1338 stop:2582 length:1245 start_codon:yes stop_codon:yes gene_type:complete
MPLFVIFRVALKALGRNRMRTALTMLGMIVGVAAVITIVALGTGVQRTLEAQFQSAGTNLITVRAGNFRDGGISQGMGSSPRLKADDVDAIRGQVPGARYLTASVATRDQVVAGGQNWFTRIEGADVELPLIRVWDIEHGTFFSPTDVNSAAKVAVLGSVVRDTLFGEGADPTGQTIRIRRQAFKVVGVLEAKGSGSFGQDQDDAIFAPYTTVQRKLRGRDGTNISGITISAYSVDDIEEVSAQIASVLREQHKLLLGEEDDFMVRTQEEMNDMLTETTQSMIMFTLAIAIVSLIVGGIGIMNIMLVSVTERTREIGLRMAVGAKGRDVLWQFLVEAIAISLVGGLIGVGLGFAASQGVTRFVRWPGGFTFAPSVPLYAVAVSAGFAAAIGIVFGFYPAWKAAQLDPIESLHFE